MSEDNLVIDVSETHGLDMVNTYKMVVIYNIVMAGWTVKKIGDDKIECSKPLNESLRQEVNLSDYIRKFLLYSIDLNNMNM